MKFCMKCMFQYNDQYNICPKCGFSEGTQSDIPNGIAPGSIIADRYIVGMPLTADRWLIRYIGWDALNEKRISIYEYMPEPYASRDAGGKVTPVKSKAFYRSLDMLKEKSKHLSEIDVPENINTVNDYFEANGTLYVISEYYSGRTLEEFLGTNGYMSQDAANNLFVPVMESIDKLHENDYVIGGFSPDNFIVTDRNTLVLDSCIKSIFFNNTEEVAGAVHSEMHDYYPYERLRSYDSPDILPANDVYSAAMVYYHLLGGAIPDCRERIAHYQKTGKDKLFKLKTKTPRLGKNCANALRNAMLIESSMRTPNMETFIKELTSSKEVALRSKKKKKKVPLAVKIAVPAAVAAIGVVVGLTLFRSGGSGSLHEGQTLVPSLIHRSLSEATEVLKSSELLVEIEGRSIDDNLDEETVTSQSVEAGSVVKVNSTVGIVISSHSEMVTMPNLLGMRMDNVRDLMFGLGLSYTVTREYSNSISKDCIISQSVEPFQKVNTDEKIRLVVSDGFEDEQSIPETSFEMEDLTGRTYDEIISSNNDNFSDYLNHNNSGLGSGSNSGGVRDVNPGSGSSQTPPYQVEVSERVYDESKPEGTVISQSAPEGSMVSTSDTVELVVSTRNKQLIVPDMRFLSRDEAEKMLIQYGLDADFEEKADDMIIEDHVVSHSPEAGELVDTGSTVKLVISLGKNAVTMPDLTGKKIDEAAKLLKEAKLAAKFTYEENSDIPEDQVTAQSAKAGSDIKIGSTVLVTVSTKKTVAEVPSVIGQTADKAEQTLKLAGFKIDKYDSEKESRSKGVTEGLVAVAQAPESGLYYPQGSNVWVMFGDSSLAMGAVDGFYLIENNVVLTVGEEHILKVYVPDKQHDMAYTPDPGESDVIEYQHINTKLADSYEFTIIAKASGTETITFGFGEAHKICNITVK